MVTEGDAHNDVAKFYLGSTFVQSDLINIQSDSFLTKDAILKVKR